LGINQHKFNAGLVYFMALALQRRSPGHAGVIEAIEWLNDHGYLREAEQLTKTVDHFTASTPIPMKGGRH